MKRLAVAGLLALALTQVSYAKSPQESNPAHACSRSLLNIDGNRIWADEEGAGKLTVVFESGFGNDSSVWSAIAPKIRAAGVKTLVYDRAGLGQSSINTDVPYSLDNDVHIMKAMVAACGVDGPVVMVAHSYGGAISLVAASQDERIKGLVLLDAVVPNVWPKSEVDKNQTAMRAQYDEIREKAPALAKVAIPFAEAMPATAKEINAIRVPATLPIIDIVAEKGQKDPASARIWQDAHKQFTGDNPHREHVLAMGSSHKVMLDQPDLVVKAILSMLQKTKAL
ncbi:alpha/beta fold hydrolase [Dyella choica]|nr:alpha/beta hydrolase [Dyella choica]